MNILYILGAYKPRASANGICSDNIIQQLVNEGHTVTVLANASIGCEDYDTKERNVEVVHIRQRLFLRISEWSELNRSTYPQMSWIVSKAAFIINKFQLLLMFPFWPVISPITNHRFKREALKFQSKNHYDAVISVYTPIETLLAGYAVKKHFADVLFIPYFLDSLSGGYGPKYFSKQKTMRRGLSIEKKIFALADKIVLMKSSEDHQREHNRLYIEKFCFLDIPMLKKINHNNSGEESRQSYEIKMLFVGSISASIRNPQTMISALSLIQEANITCEFIGNIDCIKQFEPLKEKFGQRLTFTGFMNHDQLSAKIEGADILLNIGNLVATMVPSKIFEYMSYGKPIISTFDIECEPSRKYLRQYPLALLLSGNDQPEVNAHKITDFIKQSLGKQVAYETLEKRFYLNAPEAFTQYIIEKNQENSNYDRILAR